MKINFPLPTDNKMHRFCIDCEAEDVDQARDGKLTKYSCNACGKINSRAIYFNTHKAWIDEDRELWHESSGVFVRNSEGKYLFFKRTEYPVGLTIPSGHVDKGESPEIAARRELKEETGLEGNINHLKTVNIVGDSCSAAADAHKWSAFCMDLKDDDKVISISDEGERPLWLTLSEAEARGAVFVVDYMIKHCRALL